MKILSEKQQDAFINSTARINILEGAVRSGKSFVSLLRWIDFCINGPKGPLILCGRTDKTIKRNIIIPLQNLIGNAVVYKAGKGEVQLYNRTMYVVGANDDRAEAKIRGSEFAGALIDEATLLPENFFKMLLSRMSIPGATIFASTNPDSPYHWLKRDFIDRKHELDLKNFKFSIKDNPSLSEKYIKDLTAEYKGLWYKRFILGEWVIAEGTVFDFFDEDIHVIPYPPSNADFYIVGIDYGTTNPCVFTLLGYNGGSYPNMWVEKEYYFDSRKELRQKSDYDYVQDYIKFIDGITVKHVYIDPSAASLKQEMMRNGIYNLVDAVNDVIPGIRFLGQLLTNGTLKICKDCTNLIKEFSTYVWDEKAALRGEDKPKKLNDHCFVSGSLVLTSNGNFPIEKLKTGDLVATPIGFKQVKELFVHEEPVKKYKIFDTIIIATDNHKFYTANRGWIEISKLVQTDIIVKIKKEIIWKKNKSFLTESNLTDTYNPKIELLESILPRLSQIKSKDMSVYIEKSGNIIMDQYPKECIYITSTTIPSTMILVTSSLSIPLNILNFMVQMLQKNEKKKENNTSIEYDLSQNNGIVAKKEKIGIDSTQKNVLNSQKEFVNASHAKKNTKQKNKSMQNFVQIIVNHDGEESTKLTMSLEYALTVVKNFQQINITKQPVALFPVQNYFYGKSVKVYNLHVDECHCYFVNNILTSNCLDSARYSAYTHFFTRSSLKRMTEEDAQDLERLYRR